MKNLSQGGYKSAKQNFVEEIKYLTLYTKNTTPDIINVIWDGSYDRENTLFQGA